jgi:hypothetical protein
MKTDFMVQLYKTEEQKKAAKSTGIICIALIILFIVIRWKSIIPPTPLIQDLIEINLGNNEDGSGDEQPLIKGKPTVAKEEKSAASSSSASSNTNNDDNEDKDAAALVNSKDKKNNESTDKDNKKTSNKKPKLIYKGSKTGKNGNNGDEDNGYKYQGNKNKGGDNGDASGDKDSYGDHSGGNKGGPKVFGNRNIEGSYKFEGDLSKATVYAIVEVSPSGEGTFKGFNKGTTNRNQAYENAVKNYLRKIKFNKSDNKSKVTVRFIFDID